MRISDWSSDVCSSDLIGGVVIAGLVIWLVLLGVQEHERWEQWCYGQGGHVDKNTSLGYGYVDGKQVTTTNTTYYCLTEDGRVLDIRGRSEEHTSELQSLMRISYAVFCLKKKKNTIKSIK